MTTYRSLRPIATMMLFAVRSFAQDSCVLPAFGAGVPDAEFDRLFTQTGPGWTGGDGTYSVRLPDGRDAWLFSDSYIGTVDPVTRKRSTALFQANNSLVLQNADRQTGGSTLTTLAGGTISQPGSLFQVPDGSGDWFWLGGGVVEQVDGHDKLQVLLARTRKTGGGIFDFQFVGTWIATLSLPSLTIDSLADLRLGGAINWSAAVMREENYIYIYGDENKRPHVARVPAGSLADINAWEFWNGRAWDRSPGSSARILNDSISNQFTVTRFGSSYVLVTIDTSKLFYDWRSIVLYSSCSPTGPWVGRTAVYSAPETGQANIWAYNPKAHPEWTRDGLILISYDINTTDPNGQYYADRYRPKFIRVPVSTSRTWLSSATNAASDQPGAIAPGEFVTIHGAGLGPDPGVSSPEGASTGLAGTTVTIGGVEAATSYVSASQVNAIVPSRVSGNVMLKVKYQQGAAALPLTVAPSAPGIFTTESGSGQAVVVNEDGSLNESNNPAPHGSYISFWMTGQGESDSGLSVSVSISGVTVTPAFAGLIYPGVTQVNAAVPNEVPAGAAELRVSVGGDTSPPGVTVAVGL